jgi:hypothetical protein
VSLDRLKDLPKQPTIGRGHTTSWVRERMPAATLTAVRSRSGAVPIARSGLVGTAPNRRSSKRSICP